MMDFEKNPDDTLDVPPDRGIVVVELFFEVASSA